MKYELATIEELQAVYNVVQQSINIIYPKFYPAEVVDFFSNHHSIDAIKSDIENGNVSVLKVDERIVGTGCYIDNHITRVYVAPEHQKKGYGTYIMKSIEAQLTDKYESVILDASLPAARLYEKLGYVTIKHEQYPVENDVVLAYEIMEKPLFKANSSIDYNGRRFVPQMNSENGEVSEETIFEYHQRGNMLWAEYSGGDILRGSLIGNVLENGELDFAYHHLNKDMERKSGICYSVPEVKGDGKITLYEKWEWTSGDCSSGESVLVEV